MKKIRHTLYVYWMKFAHTLGKINSVIILTLLFILVVGIYAIIKKTYLALKSLFFKKTNVESFWVDKRVREATLDELKKQF